LLVNPSSQWWLYSQLEVLCVVILALFVVEFISSSFKLSFVLAFRTSSFLLHFEFGVLLLLHELQIVVQAPSFDFKCVNLDNSNYDNSYGGGDFSHEYVVMN
jgi:hypothetical protein